MRLLNTTTLQFAHVPDSEVLSGSVQYAILSHRWGPDDDEVTYQDVLSSTDIPMNKNGFEKIKGFCKIAASLNCQYGWVDTCCIDKANSAELTEAITSMYRWYERSTICIVYLDDVPRKPMMDSEWFNRGWTLQELIAPKEIAFFSHDWVSIGTKTKLLVELSQKTRIPEDVLSHTILPSACSVAQRMSWAAKRITKRVEDRAYSLLGLFEVYMPTIYGELENAFLRLQQAITQKYKDESIFSWAMENLGDITSGYTGLYAPSPSVYIDCDKIISTPGSQGFSEAHGELSLSVELYPHSPGTCFALLNCAGQAHGNNQVAILLAKTSEDKASTEYVRVLNPCTMSRRVVSNFFKETIIRRIMTEQINVPIHPREPPSPTLSFGFWLRTVQPPGHNESQITVLSDFGASKSEHLLQNTHGLGDFVTIGIKSNTKAVQSKWSNIRWINLRFSSTFKPVLWLANDSQSALLNGSFEDAVSQQSVGQANEIGGDAEAIQRALLEYSIRRNPGKLRDGWPEGSLSIVVPKTGLRNFAIDKLNVKISIQLLPLDDVCIGPSQGASKLDSKIWVVDIVETEVMEIEVMETEGRAASLHDQTPLLNELFLLCFWPLVFLPCFKYIDPRKKEPVEELQQTEDKENWKYRYDARSKHLVLEVGANPE